MLAAVILVAIAATEGRQPAEPGLVPLTVIEIRRLFATLITSSTQPDSFHLAWCGSESYARSA
jgi:hypothetical protein